MTDDVYQRLRGAKLMRLKTQAIRNCGAVGAGVVLTPTLVPGVNVDQIGAIVDFAIAETPAVRAVHFQPVICFLRAPFDGGIRAIAPAKDPLSPRGEASARTSAADSSAVPSPLGEKDRMRGDLAKQSTGFVMTAPDDASRITLPRSWRR